jgi:hypothetical protein
MTTFALGAAGLFGFQRIGSLPPFAKGG